MSTNAIEDARRASESVVSAISKLEAENARLQTQADDRWKLQSHVGEQAREIVELKRRLDKSEKDRSESRRDADFWRKAVRYEQALKRPSKKVRHLPIYHDVIRAKRRDTPEWIGCRTNAERIFLRRWRAENKGVSGINGGRGILEIILSEDNTVAELTQRDATVAATVIQWFGTNCGRCFLEETEREIKTARDKEWKERKATA
jgi:hypothetical protein